MRDKCYEKLGFSLTFLLVGTTLLNTFNSLMQ